MSIVPAGVHDTRVLGNELVGIRLVDRKGVHVRTECDDRSLAVVEIGGQSRTADSRTDGKAEGLHLLRRDPRRPDLLERKFGILVKVSAYRREVCGERLGLFEKIHVSRSLVAGEKKPRLACLYESVAATRGEFRVPEH